MHVKKILVDYNVISTEKKLQFLFQLKTYANLTVKFAILK